MRPIVVVVQVTCFLFGVLFLGIGLAGLLYGVLHSGETTTVGSGQFTTNVPKTTVFQEYEVVLFGIWGAVMLGVAMTCEVALHALSIHGELQKQSKLMVQQPTIDVPRVILVQPTTSTPEERSAAEWIDEGKAPPMFDPPPIAAPEPTDGKIKTRCGMCGKSVKGGADWAGRSTTCPYCKAPIQFPELAMV